MPEWRTLQEKLLKSSRTVGKWVVDYIKEVSLLLFTFTAYRKRNIRLPLQAHSDILPLLFAFSHQNYV